MFIVVALAPCNHISIFIYHVKNIGQHCPRGLYLQNRDIVCCNLMQKHKN